MHRLVRRGELAKHLGTTSPTVKYYTSEGLLWVSGKTDHGQYLYDLDEMRERFQQIVTLKRRRFTIEEIKEQLGDVRSSGGVMSHA